MVSLEKHVIIAPRPQNYPEGFLNQRLKTVEDIKNFFELYTKQGGSREIGRAPPFKFVYCAKVDSKLDFSPYNIVVVKRGQQPPNHFVVSPNAVVHVRPGCPSEVYFIQQWLEESKKFEKLRLLQFFKMYLKTKMLKQWINNVKLMKFMRQRTLLSKRLFASKSSFATPTQQVVRVSYGLRLVQPSDDPQGRVDVSENDTLKRRLSSRPHGASFSVSSSRTSLQDVGPPTIRLVFYPPERPQWGYTEEGFLDAQHVHFMHVNKVLQDSLSNCIEVVSDLADTVAEAASTVPDVPTLEGLDERLGRESHVKGPPIGAFYRLERDAERQRRKRDLKKKLIEYDLLHPFLSLCDRIMTTNLYRCVITSIDTFAKHLALPRTGLHKDLKIAFQVRIGVEGTSPMSFTPDEATVTVLLRKFIQDTVARVSGLQRPSQNKDLRVHHNTSGRKVDLTLMDVLENDVSFNDSVERIVGSIQRDFKDATERVSVYEPCRLCLQFVNEEWPVEYATWPERAAEKQRSKCLSEQDIRRYISKVTKHRSELGKLTNKHCGTLCLHIEPLVKELSGRLSAVMDEIKGTLLQVTSRRLQEVGKALEGNVAALRHPPLELREFSEWVEQCEDVETISGSLLAECADVEALFVIAEDCRFDFPQHLLDKRDRTVASGKLGDPLKHLFSTALAESRIFQSSHNQEIRNQLKVAIQDTVEILENTTEELAHGDFTDPSHSAGLIVSKLHQVNNTLKTLRSKEEVLDRYSDLLGVEAPGWAEMATATKMYEKKHFLWTTVANWEEKRAYWNRTPVSQIDGEKLRDDLVELFQIAHKLHKMEPDGVTDRLLNAVTVEKANMPVMVELCNPALKEEHWMQIFDGIGKRSVPPDARTLETLRTFGAYQQFDLVSQISGVASGEYVLVKQINKIADFWDSQEFILARHRDQENCMILGGLDEISQALEEQQIQVQTCLASRYVAGIRPIVEEWDTKLQAVGDVLDEWINVQKNWIYLEFVFSSDDIKKQLPDESKLFAKVDKTFRKLMQMTSANNNVISICTEPGLLEQLRECTESLDKVQKRLEDYLETKRAAFPRFYFLSNDELLSILSDVRNPAAVQPHLQKCFDNIKELEFKDDIIITAMKSTEGEVVPFSENIKAIGNVESWLNDIERMMRKTLYDATKRTVEAYPTSVRNSWYFDFPAQCVCCVDQIVWTGEVEEVFASMQKAEGNLGPEALTAYLGKYRAQILDTVSLVKTNLTKLQRTCVCTLIVIDVHQRDIIQTLIDDQCFTVGDFNWQKQLRYYWGECDGGLGAEDCTIEHSAARFNYGYEYLGNQLRLVITPLTERAFLTCTSALHISQGAAPQGPAGTGKTESVKDLGKALARQVVVFNCSDGINYRMMSQMFAGLAQAGAWACFDEFNRIEIEVLSVVAQQMLEITTAIANNQTGMMFDGHKIRLHKNFGVFITMNPGYAGRTELPDNLKALFRPICMMIPDYALIAEIMFFSEGFSDARSLAQKMVRLYSLASQQLSKQDHYDFGMRAVKSILVMAGALKRADPDDPEDMILIRAMRDSNVPKFLRDDTKLFLALINDLFPAVEIREVPNPDLQRSVTASLTKNGLQVVQPFVQKVLQLYETMVVRHGVMLVGQTMTGKTTNSDTLANALSQLYNDNIEAIQESHKRFFHTTHVVRLNPKAISMGEMYGDVNRMTREWQDGVLSSIVRELVRNTTPDRHWVTFDGPVDAIWIENMNTVLDDNKLLCLVNGERIKVPDTISILFEVQDLRVASPATVSRCGMVFMEPYYLDGGWAPIARSRSEKISAELKNTTIEPTSVVPPPTAAQRRTSTKRASIVASAAGGDGASPPPFRPKGFVRWQHDRLMTHLNNFLPDTLEHLRTHCAEYIPTCDAQLALNLVDMVHSMVLTFLNDDDGDDLATKAGKPLPSSRSEPLDQQKAFDMMFLQSYVWCVGGNTNDRTRASFATFVKGKVRDVLPLMAFPCNGDETVFDFFMHKRSLTWQLWSFKVPQFQYNPDAPYFDLLVPTADTVILSAMLESACHINKHALINGVTGTGKSSAVSNFVVSTLHSEDQASSYAAFSITFSAQTSSHNLQETIESKLIRRRGDKVIGPQPGKKMIGIIDDCNMPQLEVYGASPPIELLRQMITQGGFYDRKKLLFKEVMDVIVVACCGEPGGGKNELSMRLTSQFLVLCVTALSTLSMKQIFNGILGGFLNSHKFPTNIIELTESTVDATLAIYTRIAAEMLPTPEKTHYTFNLRDISKVVQGILQCTSDHCLTPVHFVRLWAHESSRVFHDRLINVHDRTWWRSCVDSVIQQHFPETHSSNPSDVSMGEHGSLGSALFGSWADKKSNEYKEILDQKMLHDMLKEYQVGYNTSEMKDVDLVLFDDAVCHLARLCRILRQPRGNALLVGVGGSGRHSLCELAAYICTMECKGIVIVRNYGITEFRDDVKKILLECGAKNKSVVFLLSDNQLIDTQMLEDVNNLLNIGEVPGLMAPEDYDVIMNGCREGVRAAGKPETRNSIYQYFVSRCRDALHVILCMSPIGAPFRDRLRMFPSLVNCMTIDWYTAWPEDALLSVAKRIVARVDLGGGASSSEQLKERICQMAVYMHLTVADANDEMFKELRRRNSTTPTSYLSLLSLYLDMYANRLKEINGDISRYQNGVDKLQSTNNTIEVLKKKIRDMQPVLAKAAEEADAQNAQLVVDQAAADVIKSEVSKEEEIARSLMDEAEGIKQECADGLEEAIPALRNAEEALKTLSAKDIQEIKVFASPPANVAKTLDAVLTLLGKKEGWASAKLELGNLKFLQILAQYDRDSISAGVIRKLKKFIDDPEYVPDVIEKTSVPCKSLCLWTHAMYKYYHVAKDIAPKRERLAMAQAKVEAARAELDIKQANLSEVVKKLAELERAAKDTADRKAGLEGQITQAEAKLGRADQLIHGLGAENSRWQANLVDLKEKKGTVVGTMCLASGAVAYLGPFVSSYRSTLLQNWTAKCKELAIPVEEGFSMEALVGQFKIREWTLQGLPLDPFSIENGAILHWSKRWCLMIDPQGQANHYIRKKEAANKLKVIKLADDNYMRTLESAIQVGSPVLLENVGEELDAALDPVLLRQAIKQGGRMVLKLGEKEVEYDPNFRLYITTKLPNPTFTPELQIKVNVINFTVTRKGLEDQSLSDVVAFERSDLQERSDQCVVAIAKGKGEIKGLEDTTLRMLAESTGDILDNIELINTLSASKRTAETIANDLIVVETTNAEIDVARERYRILATRGSLIYSVIASLSNIDPMYQYSLQFYKKLFVTTLEKNQVGLIEDGEADEADLSPEEQNERFELVDARRKDPEVTVRRIAALIPAVSLTSYNVVCRGLFEKDKLLFSFMLTVTFQQHAEKFSDAEWDLFLRGGAGTKIPAEFPERPEWIGAPQWLDVAALSQRLPVFKGLGRNLAIKEAWKEWALSDTVSEVPPPSPCEDCTEWERAILVKAIRPERLVSVMRRVVDAYLAKEYTVSPQFSLREAFTDSSHMTPLIFVLSTGTDPTALFTAFADEMGFGERKLMLSLGQDQGKRAAQMIEEGRKDGLWVYLQNCHVYVSWMPTLERIVEAMHPQDTHPDFRLWLTSSPSPAFPVPVLQSGLKLTREPPKGLKANLKDFAHSLDPSVWDEHFPHEATKGPKGTIIDRGDVPLDAFMEGGRNKNREWKRLVFSLAFFHGLLQERRKFGAVGWNIAYEWSAPDFSASLKTLRIAINDFEELPWTAIKYTVGVINYGGRVTDFLDQRCLKTICGQFFSEGVMKGADLQMDKEGTYVAPSELSTIEDLLGCIERYPDQESPEVFGLHANADISFQSKEASLLTKTLISLAPRGGGSGGSSSQTPDQQVLDIADDLLKRLPAQIDTSEAHSTSFALDANGNMISLGTVLSQEIDQFNRLLRVTSGTLKELKRAIKGEVVMSSTMESMFNAFLFNLVPDNWKKAGYLCLKPLSSYFLDLIARINFINGWCVNGAPGSFWLSGFFFPQGFVTGVFQTHSRKHGIPIDCIKFRFHAQPHTDDPSSLGDKITSGVCCHGFFLEGAAWREGQLRESSPGTLHVPLPPLHFEPALVSEPEVPGMYECPLYKTSTRAGILSTTGLSTNFVINLQLPTPQSVPASHWVDRGVAALCMLDH